MYRSLLRLDSLGRFTHILKALSGMLQKMILLQEKTLAIFNLSFLYYYRLTCGLAGALFVYTHRKIVDLSQRHETSKINRFLAKRLVSLILVFIQLTLSISSETFSISFSVDSSIQPLLF